MDFNCEEEIAFCHEITQKGEKLSVRWNGGNGHGSVRLYLNDDPFEEDERSTLILDLIKDQLGHDNFDGNYASEGWAEFDRENLCFVGKDFYTEGIKGTVPFKFDIQIPSDFWFDELHLAIEANCYTEPVINVQFILSNGPINDRCQQLEDTLISQLEDKIERCKKNFDNFLGMSLDKQLPRHLFIEEDNTLTCTIHETTSVFKKVTEIDVLINLKDD